MSCLFLRDQPRDVQEALSCEPPKRCPRAVTKGPSAQIVTDVFGLLLSLGSGRESSCATRSRSITGRLLFCLRHRVVVDVTLLAASGDGQMERHTSTYRERFRLQAFPTAWPKTIGHSSTRVPLCAPLALAVFFGGRRDVNTCGVM